MARRANEPFAGKWCFVGGCGAFRHVSDPADAVKIEVDADLGCEFVPEFFCYGYEDFDERPTLALFFRGEILGEPKANPKAALEVGWFDKDEISGMELGFGHGKIAKRFFEER